MLKSHSVATISAWRLAFQLLVVAHYLLRSESPFLPYVAVLVAYLTYRAMKKSPRWTDEEERNVYLPTPQQIADECRRIRSAHRAKPNDDRDDYKADNWIDDEEGR